jgi:hypothetical protein
MGKPVELRSISNEEGNRLLRLVRRGAGNILTWRRAQIVLWAAQGYPVGRISRAEERNGERPHHEPVASDPGHRRPSVLAVAIIPVPADPPSGLVATAPARPERAIPRIQHADYLPIERLKARVLPVRWRARPSEAISSRVRCHSATSSVRSWPERTPSTSLSSSESLVARPLPRRGLLAESDVGQPSQPCCSAYSQRILTGVGDHPRLTRPTPGVTSSCGDFYWATVRKAERLAPVRAVSASSGRNTHILLCSPRSAGGRRRTRRGESGGTVARTQTRPSAKCTSPSRASWARWSGSRRERPLWAAVTRRRRSATAPGPTTGVQ